MHVGLASRKSWDSDVNTPRAFLFYRLGEWLFLAWIALVPVMQPWHVRIAGRFWLQIADVVFVFAAPAYVASVLAGQRRIRLTSWCRAALLFLAALAISALASEHPRQSFLKLPADAYVILGAVMTVGYVSSREALRKALLAWMAGTFATILATAAGIALFAAGVRAPGRNLFLFQFGSLPPGPYPRLRAFFLDGNMFCSYAVVSTMAVVAAYQAGVIGRRTATVLFFGAAVSSILSLSPGLGGLFLAAGLWYWRSRRVKAAAGAGILAAVAFLLIATISPTPLRSHSVWGALRHPEPSARVLTWIDAGKTFLAHPFLGRGLDMPAAHVLYPTASGVVKTMTDAQNTWLSIMAQAGLPGLLAFAAVMFSLTRRFRWFSPHSDPVRAALELALLGGVVYQLLTESFENTRHVWILMGLVSGVQSMDDESAHHGVPRTE
jgi:hypothetical protein